MSKEENDQEKKEEAVPEDIADVYRTLGLDSDAERERLRRLQRMAAASPKIAYRLVTRLSQNTEARAGEGWNA